MKVKSLSRARLLATPWTAAYQAPPFMRFSRQEYWSRVPLPSPRVDLGTLKELDTALHTCGLSVKQEPHDPDHKPFHHPGVIGTPLRDRRGAAPSQPTVHQVSLPDQWALKPRGLLAGGL